LSITVSSGTFALLPSLADPDEQEVARSETAIAVATPVARRYLGCFMCGSLDR
jgi:hypothetical protein